VIFVFIFFLRINFPHRNRYFESAEDDSKNKKSKNCEYQPASDSSEESDDEEDPLDSFMSSIEVS
jgi:hypothetical protein